MLQIAGVILFSSYLILTEPIAAASKAIRWSGYWRWSRIYILRCC